MYDNIAFTYLKLSAGEWVMLPYLHTQQGVVPINFVSINDVYIDQIKVKLINTNDPSTSPITGNVTFDFKTVLIPKNEVKTNSDLDFSNYQKVVKVFNLK